MFNVNLTPRSGDLVRIASHLSLVLLLSNVSETPSLKTDVLRVVCNDEIFVYISKVKSVNYFYYYVMTENGELGYIHVDNLELVSNKN